MKTKRVAITRTVERLNFLYILFVHREMCGAQQQATTPVYHTNNKSDKYRSNLTRRRKRL